jgi:hypothetical protein
LRASAALLLAVAGCADPVAPVEDARIADFFTQEVFGLPNMLTTATPGTRSLLITGILVSPGTSYQVTGELTARSDTLDLVIRGSRPAASQSVRAQHYYAATIGGLIARTYQLRVFHSVQKIADPAAWDTTSALDRAVGVQ